MPLLVVSSAWVRAVVQVDVLVPWVMVATVPGAEIRQGARQGVAVGVCMVVVETRGEVTTLGVATMDETLMVGSRGVVEALVRLGLLARLAHLDLLVPMVVARVVVVVAVLVVLMPCSRGCLIVWFMRRNALPKLLSVVIRVTLT